MRAPCTLAMVALLAACAPTATAFVTAGPSQANGERDAFADAPRWDHFGATLLEHERRTLGGGIEFSIAADLCERLLPRFNDRRGLACRHLEGAIAASLAAWSRDHPTLRFVDVSTQRSPDLANGTGAELDFAASDQDAHPMLRDHIAWTQTFYDSFGVYGTHGQNIGRLRMLSADVIFDEEPGACYYYRASAAKAGCNHFPSLVLHEVGHALGLDHPEDHRARNIDFAPEAEPRQIDCEDPRLRLVSRAPLAAYVVMRGGHAQGMPVRWELSPDDLLGRDYLYPPCGVPPRPGFPDQETLPVRAAVTSTQLPAAGSSTASLDGVCVVAGVLLALGLLRRGGRPQPL